MNTSTKRRKDYKEQLPKELMQAILKKLNRPAPESTTPQDYKDINKGIDERLKFDEKIGRWVYLLDGKESDIFHNDDLEKSLPAPDDNLVGHKPMPGYRVIAPKIGKKAKGVNLGDGST